MKPVFLIVFAILALSLAVAPALGQTTIVYSPIAYEAYSPVVAGYEPVVAYSPVVAAAPTVTSCPTTAYYTAYSPAPTVAYAPVPTTVYYTTYYPTATTAYYPTATTAYYPTATTAYYPTATTAYYPTTAVPVTAPIVASPLVPGQPVRNLLRTIFY